MSGERARLAGAGSSFLIFGDDPACELLDFQAIVRLGAIARKNREVVRRRAALADEDLICPLLSGPESLLFWIMKEFGNGQEA
ncbi:MAG: hypothetical protein QHC67_12740, partial [Sphingobium sp.]|uniref:hypothetical protein n=1 Tax=Sphingobium sp. TaxID=1912891 RepID=UPI0029B9094F